MKCLECGSEMRFTDEPMVAIIHGESFNVPNIMHWQCDKCGEDLTDAENSRKIAEEAMRLYRLQKGLLSPDDIRCIRKKHNLSQQDFEKALGVSTPTVSRWETGSVVQPKSMDNLLRAFGTHECVADEMIKRAEILDAKPSFSTICINLEKMLKAKRDRSIEYV